MFGKRNRALLEGHLRDAHNEIARIKSNPFVALAHAIKDEVDSRIEAVDPDQAVEQATAEFRQEFYQKCLRALVSSRSAKRLEDEKEALKERAKMDAEELAQQAVEKFRIEEADTYLAEETQKIKKIKLEKLVETEKERLREKAFEKVGQEAAAIAVS